MAVGPAFVGLWPPEEQLGEDPASQGLDRGPGRPVTPTTGQRLGFLLT